MADGLMRFRSANPAKSDLEVTGDGPRPGQRSVFAQLAKNIGWVIASRGFNSLIVVAYLAIAARALGPAEFGAFMVILTYAQLFTTLVQFQSWKTVVRYGALHIAAQRSDRLKRLFGFTATLDLGSGVAGAIVAILGVPLVAPLFHWSAQDQIWTAIFSGVLLLTTGTTPSGILRLFDRFDLTAYCEAVGPLVRLGGAVVAWSTGADAVFFLLIWMAAAVAQGLAKWLAVLFITNSRLSFGLKAARSAIGENERIWPFMLQTNFSSSVSMFWGQLGTLAVGAFVGATEAGAFRLARRLSEGLIEPIKPITVAIYPELSRLVAEDDHGQLRTVVKRTTIVSAILALLLVIVVGIGGREILEIIAGSEFGFAHQYFFLLSIATAIDLTGFAFEPVQNAHGRSWKILRAKLIAAAIYGALLVALLPPLGAEGAAIAAIVCSLAIFVQLATSTRRLLRNGE